MKKLTAYCGLDCEACDARIATVTGNEALREKTARLWSELNHCEISPEMISCMGCRAEGVKSPFCESMCPIRQCAMGKGLETCGGCGELESCGIVAAIHKNNPAAKENLSGT